jgi:hypothetical protein
MDVIRFSDLCAQGQVAGKRIFIRSDLNVPQDDAGNITEDTRIRASIACIAMALEAGAAVMVTSHLGRPTEGTVSAADSLAPVAKRLGELMQREVPLVRDWVDGVTVAPGALVLLEKRMMRCWPGKWRPCVTSLCMMHLAPRTAPKPAPTVSPSTRRWPVPGPCWPQR